MKAENAAALAALEAAWLPAQVHATGDVPTSPVTPYAVVSVSSGLPDNYRTGARHTSKRHRIAVQAMGRTASEVSFAAEKADAAFLDKRLPVTGRATTPARGEVSSPIIRDPDGGGLLSCTLTYTFTSSPA